VIRAACAEDRAALAAILRGDASFGDDECVVALQLIDGALAGDPDYRVRVAVDGDRDGAGGDRVVGYVCYGATPMTAASFDLYWLVVDAAHRGLGLGRGLIEQVEAEIRAAGGGNVRIETSPAAVHAAARALYSRLGYPVVCELAGFYRADEPLLLYYKRIDGAPA
jgi:ribosomal protein S18 acetylase RimI-like enzyme